MGSSPPTPTLPPTSSQQRLQSPGYRVVQEPWKPPALAGMTFAVEVADPKHRLVLLDGELGSLKASTVEFINKVAA